MRSSDRGRRRASRAAGWRTPAKGLVLGLSELAILTVVVVGLKAVIPVEALASLYVLAVLPIAVGWGFAWALTSPSCRR